MALNKKYLLALQSLQGIGPQKILKIGNYIIDNNIEINDVEDLLPVLKNLKIKVNKSDINIDILKEAVSYATKLIALNEKEGIGITTFYDVDYPEILKKTINEEGKNDPPIVLYYKGDLSITNLPQLAVIGTREITSFGERAGEFLASQFSKQGFCIVSGLALGCDTVGHKSALSANGKTIAFLATGLDTIYPPENKELANEIIEKGGLLMSEYPIGIGVNRYNLVKRDRLQAGLAMATLVIQTGEHGGTMHAAKTTLLANKPLYVVKFSKDEQNKHEMSLGNAILVKNGARYISGSDNIKDIANYIKNYIAPKTDLF